MLVLPFVVLAGLGPGTMVEAADDGEMRFVLCTGQGMVEAIMMPDGQVHLSGSADQTGPDQTGQDHPQPGPSPAEQPCAWALQGQPVLADAAIGLDPPLALRLATAFVVDIPLHLRRADVLTPAARGPPAIL